MIPHARALPEIKSFSFAFGMQQAASRVMAGKESSQLVSGRVHLEVSLTTSTPTISLSGNPTATSLQVIVTARIISSSQPAFAITLCTESSILDNGRHERQDGLFWGALPAFNSTTNPDRSIQIAFVGSPNYGSMPNASPSLREWSWMRFETVPSKGQGALTITHDLSLDRLFLYSQNLKAADVQPGEKFRIRIIPKRAFRCDWWNFGDVENEDLKDKKFARWVLPDEDGDISNLSVGEERPDIEQMEKEGWVFSQKLENLQMTETEAGDKVIVEFVK